ncbi:hypothetical protein AALP_AA2G209700, partial [Arabis alpina]
GVGFSQPSAGYRGGDHTGGVPTPETGYKGGQGIPEGTGYKGGSSNGKPGAGGDPGAAIVILPKKPPATIPVPTTCTTAVTSCINNHIYGDSPPKRGDYCCTQFKYSKLCLCRYQTSGVDEIMGAANAIAKSCGFVNTKCPASSGGGGEGQIVETPPDIPEFPMPQVCRQEVRDCVLKHLYGDVRPKYHGPCCMKFKHSKLCVCKFQTSGIYELSKGAYDVVKGCNFRKTDCPRTY